MNLPQPHARTEADQAVDVNLTVNGTEVALSLPARVTLSDALRDHLGLTGTHVGCEHGICGMCTVLVDGDAARACLLFAVQLDGAEITTVEGLGWPDELHPLQESFGRHHGLQCGFCTPGFLMSSYDLLTHEPEVQRDDLSTELSGVLCRCTGYRNIIDAVDDVAQAHRGALPGPGNCGQRTLVGRTSATTPAAVAAESDVEEEPTERPEEIELPAGAPTIHIDVTSQLASGPDEVAHVFGDIRLLARCLPGAELTDELGADWYRGRARIALGPMRMAFTGIAHIEEQTADRIVMRAQGKDTGGGAQARIVMSATAVEGGGTALRAEASVFLTGRIAGFGRSLAGDVSRRMFEEFARAVDRAAAGEEEPTAGTRPPGAISLLVATILDRVRAFVRRLTTRGAHRR
ncbi:carbon-monoxide dehydrogenase small subunit [Nocardioides luteus]|uniref:Carbon monoxide dehydrogenase n=1 Tax=Nocardioides luteus TaxID=1844 RepID=A0ABQ5T3P0_9ACTN|nr:2Fe-2S iron-sulfur cluster-binding protein [Nocardioides luteus]MDR7310180.1 carbon-monoxide dehydrogenase small subunit [Nocardioides luteus]GGR69356.1 carbon monoxide dehydrogenase [Nocardioides luteus]GLJ70352.1 carbon monoxide dehydrogenase [Nocardioides luteus]